MNTDRSNDIEFLQKEIHRLKKENELYKTVIDSIDYGIYAVDENDVITIYSGVTEQIEGRKRSKMLGRPEMEAYGNEDEDILHYHNRFTNRLKKTKKPLYNCVHQYYTDDKKPVKLIFDMVPFFYEGEYAGYYSIGYDDVSLKDMSASVADRFHQLMERVWIDAQNKDTLEHIVGNSKRMRDCVDLSRRMALRDIPTMLIGETGVGKELFANGIHNASSRREGPFVPINCAAIPDSLLESILFGTVKGAFTGAVDKPGLFEQAENGTIFLDEINSMPLSAQAKLLRAIQEKKIRRVGSQQEISINCRIISATNADLFKTPSSFRSDLFFRLAVANIRIPPLRDRGEDVLLLAEYFIRNLNRDFMTNIDRLSEELKQLLLGYHWPGNVRELQNIITIAMNMVDKDDIELQSKHIPDYLFDQIRGQKTDFVLPSPPPIKSETLRESIKAFEKSKIESTLIANKWNVSQTANVLGILRENLYKKMKEYGIRRP